MATIFVVRPRTGNIGNDLIALGTENFLKDAFGPATNIVTLSSSEAGARKSAGGLNATNIYEMNRLADGVVVGPGNLFENGSLVCELDALASLSVPLMLFSVSTAQIYDRSGKLASRTDSLSPQKIVALCQAAKPSVVRDETTRRHLENLGLQDMSVGGCPSLYLQLEKTLLPRPDAAMAGATLISIRAPSLMSAPYHFHAKLRQDLREIILLLQNSGRERIRILCHDYRDLAFAAEFADIPAIYTEDVRQFLGWLRDCDLNITFRLHAFVPCLALGTPSINLSYDQRAMSLIETIGMTEWDINFIQERDVIDSIRDRLKDLPRLEEIKKTAQPAWERARTALTEAVATFAKRVEARRRSLRF